MELGREGILVNSVNIGLVETPQWENIRADVRRTVTGRGVLRPAGRGGGAARDVSGRDEVGGLVAFLAGDRASYIDGNVHRRRGRDGFL